MKPFIVIPDGFNAKLFEELKNNDSFEVYPEKKITQDKLKELLPKTNAIVIRSATKMTKEYIDMAPNLKYIIRAGEGTDNIDKVYCQEKGIKVSNTPGANSNSVAEHAIALMLTTLRKTAWAHESTKNGKWEKAKFSGNEIFKKKIGFVGFGKIGQIAAKRLSGFEPAILYYSPSGRKVKDIPNAKLATLDEIFSECDIISLHLPLNDKSRGLIGNDLLSQMKSNAILVNTARGGVVDEEALYVALKEGKIKGAAMDVFANEPLEEGSKLRELENIVLVPHLGASTDEAQERVGEMAVDQLREFFLNNLVINEVKA